MSGEPKQFWWQEGGAGRKHARGAGGGDVGEEARDQDAGAKRRSVVAGPHDRGEACFGRAQCIKA